MTFHAGDLVWRDENVAHPVAIVVGRCPGDAWIRVRTPDGKWRIWQKSKLSNMSRIGLDNEDTQEFEKLFPWLPRWRASNNGRLHG